MKDGISRPGRAPRPTRTPRSGGAPPPPANSGGFGGAPPPSGRARSWHHRRPAPSRTSGGPPETRPRTSAVDVEDRVRPGTGIVFAGV
eukprot:756182-Alexandrium_andersonii.AAC.1